MITISCLIVEDEPHAMQLLEDHIAKVPYLRLAGKSYDAMDALNFLSANTVDVIFLDINMPILSGMEMAAMIKKEQKIIFTTAYSAYAVDSFEYHVIDYLLKPITFKRFMQSVNKLQALNEPAGVRQPAAGMDESRLTHTNLQVTPAAGYLFVKSGKQIHKIEYASVFYLEALKEYIAIHTKEGKVLVYKRMKEMAGSLPQQFVRIHNSYIVNVEHIRQIHAGMVQVNDTRLPISNSYRELFNSRISTSLL